ncbi:hypothetical protein [Caballeronia mineralivorans]|uniref:hypothetical protein n=1 Tax=Caballeronia mineralivorans TaxID=2010198 RepID=UPI000AD8A46E|nr:hypothetical protein [Caballeronia mineralivorans]
MILSAVYPARIKAIKALLRIAQGDYPHAAELTTASSELDQASLSYGRASTAVAYAGLAGLLRIVSTLVEWRGAVLDAAPDADRFARSARERYRQWNKEYGDKEPTKALASASRNIAGLQSLEDVERLCSMIAAVPLPVGVFAEPKGIVRITRSESETKSAPTELSVAFLKFNIDGIAVSELHHLTPNEVHDLEIEVRVSRWPDDAEQLRLSPVTIEPRATYSFPDFVFNRPTGQPPFVLVDRGRALLKVAQGLQARPFEFKYAAEFLPTRAEQPVSVVGHRTLLIEGLDLQANPITGYPNVDRKIVQIRDELRQRGSALGSDLGDLLKIVSALSNMAGRAVQDAEFDGVWSEAEFQDYVRKELRRRPEIGVELDEHAHASGGITDLSFHGIAIELKAQSKRTMSLEDCQQYVEQTTSYVAAKGKNCGVLCVLDCSPKTSAPQPVDAGIGILEKSTSPGHVVIVAVLVQGNLRRPSSL